MKRAGAIAAIALGCGGPPLPPPAPPPPAPTCDRLPAVIDLAIAGTGGFDGLAPAAAHALVTDMKRTIVERCTQDAWAPATIQCLLDAVSADALGTCDDRLTTAQRASFDGAMQRLIASAVAPPPSEAPIGIAECDAYIADVARYATCAQLPQDARDQLGASLGSLRAGFAPLRDPTVTDAARAAAGDGCRAAAAAMRDGMVAAGCGP